MRIRILAVALVATPALAQPPRLAPLSAIGCAECSGPALFTRVAAIAVTPDRQLVVLDRSVPHVRLFHADGRVLGAFGRTGQGPAELQSPIAVARRADGVIEVVDLSRRSLVRFDSTGADRGTVPLGGFATAGAFAPAGGHALAGLTGPMTPTLDLVRVGADNKAALVKRIGPSEFPSRPPGSPSGLSIAVAADGSFAVGDGRGAYHIRRYQADGSPAGEIRRAIARVPKTAEQLAEDRQRLDSELARMQAMIGGRRTMAPSHTAEIPTERPYFDDAALRFDERGNLWVRVERAVPGHSLFDVFDAAGRYLGEVPVPAEVGDFALGAGLLATAVRDALDVEQVRVWTVIWP